jgi:hypothetical protein
MPTEIRGPDDAGEVPATMGRPGDARHREELPWSLLVVELRVHAARMPTVNRRYAAVHERLVTAVAEMLERTAAARGERPPVPSADAARVFLALGSGAALERCADPDSFPVDLMVTAMSALAPAFTARTAVHVSDRASDGAPAVRPPRRAAR